MFICMDCRCIFDEPAKFSEDATPGGFNEGGSFVRRWTGCPACGGSFDMAVECDNCGELYFDEELIGNENGKYCQHCIEELEEKENL